MGIRIQLISNSEFLRICNHRKSRKEMPSTRSQTKKKSKKQNKGHPTYIRMAFEAIMTQRSSKGMSRAMITNYIKANYDDIAEGSHFNAALRRALKEGIDRGVLEEGATSQRFKITKQGRMEAQSKGHKVEENKKRKKKKDKKGPPQKKKKKKKKKKKS